MILADISSKDHASLAKFGINEVPWDSWREPSRDSSSILKILSICDRCLNAEFARVFSCTLQQQPEAHDLASYFETIQAGIQSKKEEVQREHLGDSYIVLNLMPYYLSPSRAGKIITGLFSPSWKAAYSNSKAIVLLVRNLDLFLKSNTLLKVTRERTDTYPVLYFVDIRGYGIKFEQDGLYENFDVPRHCYNSMLGANENIVRNILIWKTNSYISHYRLPHSHVRTHYDMSDFIVRDDVWEYVFEKFVSLMGALRRVLLIGIGMEHSVTARMGNQLKRMLKDSDNVHFLHCTGKPASEILDGKWSESYDGAIVISDIINSGLTFSPFLKQLQSTNSNGSAIKGFVVARMKNSPTEREGVSITSALTIMREYYDPGSCKLCKIEQPFIDVDKESDFHRVLDEQLTPFDFWEMVKDAKALKRNEVAPNGRKYCYRVDTTSLLKKYEKWLSNIIRHKYTKIWKNNSIHALVTVAEPTGESFANLVSMAIGVKTIICVPRDDLKRITPKGGLPKNLDNRLTDYSSVLIVDDGINYGDTISSLLLYAKACGSQAFGVLVFDNRLDERGLIKLQKHMNLSNLVALYTWPTRTKAL
ncbi:MAG: hypothetical protein U1F77_07800 [Kiritimatiellia bacterium]